jgi:hypothetical protein
VDGVPWISVIACLLIVILFRWNCVYPSREDLFGRAVGYDRFLSVHQVFIESGHNALLMALAAIISISMNINIEKN